MNITLEVQAMNGKLITNQSVTFYSIDNITPVPGSNKSVIIMSGGREYIATCSYEELWDKIKRENESTPR